MWEFRRIKQNKKITKTKDKEISAFPLLEVKNLSFSYDKTPNVLQNINLTVKDNEFLTILGPSGCGKTTLLRLIGGFEKIQTGEIILEGKDIKKISSNQRNIKTIFQHLGLFPHLNVEENIAFSLQVKKVPKKEINIRVTEILNKVSLTGFEKRSIDSLSGGQKQRIAMARSLITNPDILLLDEPFSALDIKLKKHLEKEIKAIQKKTQTTFILVTHDQEQGLLLSDRLVVLNKGRIIQQGIPTDIYNEPNNAWLADFIGSSSIIKNALFIKNGLVSWDNVEFECIDVGFGKNALVDVVLRPEDIKIVDKAFAPISGIIKEIYFKGVHWNIFVKTLYRTYEVHTVKKHTLNSEIGLIWEPEDIHIMKVYNEK